MKFNINDTVKVRLTDKGKDELRAQYEDLQLFCTSLRPYQEPVEDDKGYSEWQWWDLMSRFGELLCGCGSQYYFEYFDVEIIIPDTDALPILEQQERGEGGWIEWGGGECPVEGDSKVETRLRCGLDSDADEARLIYWNHAGRGSDVIAYRIIPERDTNQNGENL